MGQLTHMGHGLHHSWSHPLEAEYLTCRPSMLSCCLLRTSSMPSKRSMMAPCMARTASSREALLTLLLLLLPLSLLFLLLLSPFLLKSLESLSQLLFSVSMGAAAGTGTGPGMEVFGAEAADIGTLLLQMGMAVKYVAQRELAALDA